jgi:chromosome segregation ATPase
MQALQAKVTALEEDNKRIRQRQASYEEGVIQTRAKHFEQQAIIAAGVLATNASLAVVESKVDTIHKAQIATSEQITSLTALVQRRFETDDEREGKLLAELAALHGQDSTLEQANAEIVEEVTEIRAAHAEAIGQLEVERAGKTSRAGALTALGAAIMGYLKANPDAFEKAWHAVGRLFP